jgi:hypothetical protein
MGCGGDERLGEAEQRHDRLLRDFVPESVGTEVQEDGGVLVTDRHESSLVIGVQSFEDLLDTVRALLDVDHVSHGVRSS